VLHKIVLQRGPVFGQGVGFALPRQPADARQAAGGELVEVALDAAAGDAGQAGDFLVGQTLTLEPEDGQLLLDARMRVMVALVADGVEVFGGEDEAAHGGFLCS
jgi:hypothetical protein